MAPGFESGKLGSVIKPVTARNVPHASTPHASTATSTKATPSWLTTAALTPAQIQAEATAEANQSIAPQVQGLQGQQQRYDAEQAAQRAALQGFYAAMAPYLSGISGATSAAYNSAATAMGDIGHGYAGVLGANADKNTAEMNAALQRAGQAPVTGLGSGLTDAFAATHGGIQGQSFAAEGAAHAADAANRPAIWAAQGRDSLIEGIQKAVAGDAQWAAKISDVYASVPSLRATILHQVQSEELSKQQLRDTEQTLGLNKTKATQSYQTQMAKLKAQEAHWQQQSKDTNASILERQQAAEAGRQVRLQIAKLNAANKASTKSKFKSAGDVSVAVQKEVAYLAAHPKYAPPPAGSLPGVKGPAIPLDWQTTANNMFSAYITPYVNSLPAKDRATVRAQLKTALINAMNQAGIVRP